MKVIKVLLLFLLSILIFSFFVACSSENTAPKCLHDDKIICTTCGEVTLGNTYYSNLLNSINLNGVQTKITGNFTATLNEENSTFIYEDDSGYYRKLVASNVIINVNGDMISNLHDSENHYANGIISLNAKMIDNSNNALVEINFTFDKIEIKNGLISYKVTEKTFYPTLTDTERKINEKTLTYENSTTIENFAFLPYFKNLLNNNESDKNLAIATLLNDISTLTKDGKNSLFTINNIGTVLKNRLNLEGVNEDIFTFLDKNLTTKFIADDVGNILYIQYAVNLDAEDFYLLGLIDGNNLPNNLNGQMTIKTTFTNY